MAVNPTSKKLIERQMETLDYMEGAGIFPKDKRRVNSNNRYLIISYGGTGADVLYPIKKLFEKELTTADMADNVRLLAIDSDRNTRYEKLKVKDDQGQETTVDVERFSTSEFLWLDNVPAKNAIEMGDFKYMEDWLNPDMPATIKNNETYLDGAGAGATRQVGRVLLFPQDTFDSIVGTVTQLAHELTDNNDASLKIFIISGISGGTGSGIVVDTSYIVRHAIKSISSDLYARTAFCGFILLPPTGKSSEKIVVERGNRNGVAALKEIDHFMTIAKRGERYVQRFGATLIQSEDNIFTNCYLLDGNLTGVTLSQSRERAVEVVSDCMLDMVTSMPIATAAGTTAPQDVASFMSDTPAFAEAMVSGNSEDRAPRDANYIYCVLGHGKTLIPIDLMKAYVAKHVYDNMYRLFKNCESVQEEDVENFLKAVGAPDDGALTGASKKADPELANAVDQAVAAAFMIDPQNPGKKGGPYYCINLLNLVAAELRNRMQSISNKAIATAKEARLAQLRLVGQRVVWHNETLFEVYVAVIEEMQKYLRDTSKILTDSEVSRNYNSSTYTFAPIDFAGTDVKSQVVQQYLNTLVSSQNVRALCADLINEVLRNRAAWTELVVPKGSSNKPRFAAPQLLRAFWARHINRIVNATLEDYLIKYYSGDPNAKYSEVNGVVDPQADQALREAAKEIVTQMWGPAGAARPLAELHTGLLSLNNFNGQNSFLIPEAAPHLIKYVQNELNANPNLKNVKVAPSTASDRISCYGQYTCLPAYMFKWSGKAEPHYESALANAHKGLHMSETKGGNIWRDFPNLVNETVWPNMGIGYGSPREAALSATARQVFDGAKALGLTELKSLASNADFGYYTVSYLPDDMSIDSQLLKDIDTEMEGSTARKNAQSKLDKAVEDLAAKLYAMKDWSAELAVRREETAKAISDKVSFVKRELKFTDTVMVPLAIAGQRSKEHDGWEEALAAKLLRTVPETSYRLRSTVLVLEKLYEMISKAQGEKKSLNDFAHYLVAGLFEYDEAEGAWLYSDDTGVQRELFVMTYNDQAQETAAYYFVFGAYDKLSEDAKAALKAQYDDIMAAVTDPALSPRAQHRQNAIAMVERSKPFAQNVASLLTVNRADPSAQTLATVAYAKLCATKGYDVEAIRAFYANLKTVLDSFTA